LRDRERIRVSDRELRRTAANFCEARRGASVQLKFRRAARMTHDLDIAPEHTLRVPGAKRFHRRFLGRKPAREMDGRIVAAHAVRHFRLGEDPVGESLAITLDGVGDARNICGVESQSDDRHVFTA